MKVKVLQANEVRFRSLHWWSDWVDIAVFNYASEGYLLQMKVSRWNAKKFKTVAMKSFGLVHVEAQKIGDLMDINEARGE